MSKSPFPQRQQTPLFAIRSCIADRANTVNRTEFENLKLVVADAKTKCDEVVKKTNDVIKQANDLAERTNLFAIVFDSMYTYVYPTDTIYYSAKPPSEFMLYQDWTGNFGWFSGNWGFTENPVTELEFTWFDPAEKSLTGDSIPKFDDLMQRELCPDSIQPEPEPEPEPEPGDGTGTETGTVEETETQAETPTDPKMPTTTPGGGLKHKFKIPIYAYWCQKEEPPNAEIPEDKPEPIEPVT